MNSVSARKNGDENINENKNHRITNQLFCPIISATVAV